MPTKDEIGAAFMRAAASDRDAMTEVLRSALRIECMLETLVKCVELVMCAAPKPGSPLLGSLLLDWDRSRAVETLDKVAAIKALRMHCGASLKAAKMDMVDRFPYLLDKSRVRYPTDDAKENVETLVRALRDAGVFVSERP